MSTQKLEVIDREGWRKEYLLEKTLTHIGSDTKNDIVLEVDRGSGVLALHAQLVTSGNGGGYRLVNLGAEDIPLGDAGQQTLAPRSILPLNDGQIFKLGEFVLIYRSSGAAPAELSSGSSSSGGGSQIGLTITLPQTRLAPMQSLRGIATIRNLGNRSGAKFDVDVEGLEPDCYEIEPGPLLPAGAEKDISFVLHHRGSKPLAGERRITFRATAPNAYPVEQAIVPQIIQILPYYHHKLQLLPPHSAKKAKAQPSPPSKEDESPQHKPRPPVQPDPEIDSTTADWWAAEAPPGPPPRAKVADATAAEAPVQSQTAQPDERQPPAKAKTYVQVEEVETISVETSPAPVEKESPETTPAQSPKESAPSKGEEEAGRIEISRSKRWWVSVSQYFPFARQSSKGSSPEPAQPRPTPVEPEHPSQAGIGQPAPVEMKPPPAVDPVLPSLPVQEIKGVEAAAPLPATPEPAPEIAPSPPPQEENPATLASQTAVLPEDPALAEAAFSFPLQSEPIEPPNPSNQARPIASETSQGEISQAEQSPPASVDLPPSAEQPSPEVQAAANRPARVQKPRTSKAKANVPVEAQPPDLPAEDQQMAPIEPPLKDEAALPQEEDQLKQTPLPPAPAQPAPSGTQADDWWSVPDKIEKPQIRQPQPPPATGQAEDWWSIPEETKPAERPGVLKLKGDSEAAKLEEPPPPADDWWSAAPGTPAQENEKQPRVIKLKATAETEAKKEAAGETGKRQRSQTEEWWGEADKES